MLVNFPQRRVVVDTLARDAEKLGLGRKLHLWGSNNPLLSVSDLHEGHLLNMVALGVENTDGGSSSVNGQGGTAEGSAGFANHRLGGPDTEDGANTEVAVDH